MSDVRDALASVLRCGLLSIRGNSSKKEIVFLESDHLHNLPVLLKMDEKSPDFHSLLKFYWEVERPCYLAQAPPELTRVYIDDWKVIESYLSGLNGL